MFVYASRACVYACVYVCVQGILVTCIFRGYYMGQTILHFILHTFEPYCTSAIAR